LSKNWGCINNLRSALTVKPPVTPRRASRGLLRKLFSANASNQGFIVVVEMARPRRSLPDVGLGVGVDGLPVSVIAPHPDEGERRQTELNA